MSCGIYKTKHFNHKQKLNSTHETTGPTHTSVKFTMFTVVFHYTGNSIDRTTKQINKQIFGVEIISRIPQITAFP